jgi:hypothetical protein
VTRPTPARPWAQARPPSARWRGKEIPPFPLTGEARRRGGLGGWGVRLGVANGDELETVAQAQPPRCARPAGRSGGLGLVQEEEAAWRRAEGGGGEAEEGEGRGPRLASWSWETEEDAGWWGPPGRCRWHVNLLRFGRFIGIHGVAFIYLFSRFNVILFICLLLCVWAAFPSSEACSEL